VLVKGAVEMDDLRFHKLGRLAEQLPRGLVSDWEGTNHFELQAAGEPDGPYFWLHVLDDAANLECVDSPCHTETGRKYGLLMDLAAEVRRLYEDGAIGSEPVG